jgi:hypothetical protein
MKPKHEYLWYLAGLSADGVELGAYEQVAIQRLIDLTVAECCLALTPQLGDMISRGQAVDMIKQRFGVEE